jgi:hypothetical protein
VLYLAVALVRYDTARSGNDGISTRHGLIVVRLPAPEVVRLPD